MLTLEDMVWLDAYAAAMVALLYKPFPREMWVDYPRLMGQHRRLRHHRRLLRGKTG